MLIIGGGGFIGSHLTAKLVSDGFEVTVFDNSDGPAAYDLQDKPGVSFIKGNILDKASPTGFRLRHTSTVHS